MKGPSPPVKPFQKARATLGPVYVSPLPKAPLVGAAPGGVLPPPHAARAALAPTAPREPRNRRRGRIGDEGVCVMRLLLGRAPGGSRWSLVGQACVGRRPMQRSWKRRRSVAAPVTRAGGRAVGWTSSGPASGQEPMGSSGMVRGREPLPPPRRRGRVRRGSRATVPPWWLGHAFVPVRDVYLFFSPDGRVAMSHFRSSSPPLPTATTGGSERDPCARGAQGAESGREPWSSPPPAHPCCMVARACTRRQP